ncbi:MULTISPECIES: hypothetical protein [Bacillus cereus group]|uniref:hypothetical protein n=1 Tax=Bacillus cereus group TaxID=86661 RepID=UPI000279C60F|nr:MULTISPECIES: hypothetical protein [Bacillus cereus group]EJR57243.1 hypothetical protein IIO_04770 [Bacillus cereus VD115]PKR92777.1 hypothetical protein bcere0024_01250 [Bacillus cereus Rock4-18]MBJ8097856.1 hypothetical protein [Bacillus cereus group sp. N11]PEJ62432.1 hypothetical protein CN906_20780 [Bacillus toyonensis]PEN67139.1 hypothetical protein CN545_18685 [Bacillus toyonensis]
MTKAIFTKGTCKKFELFDIFVQVALNGGWKLKEGSNLTDDQICLYTDGYNGDKHMAVHLTCYDSNYSPYNIRTTDYTDGSMRMGTMQSNNTVFYSQDGMSSFCFFPGRTANQDTNTSYARQYNKLFDMEYYYYVDKEVIIFLVVPFKYTGLGNGLIFLGFPEQSFVEESKRNENKSYSGAVYANSGYCGNVIGSYRLRVADNPKNLLEVPGKNTIAQGTYSLVSPLSPNIDKKFVLSEVFYGDSTTGMRGRLGKIYLLQQGGILDGDIIEIKVNNEIQKYRYTVLGGASSNYTSFVTNAAAIRVE